jgi:hypothetical protein
VEKHRSSSKSSPMSRQRELFIEFAGVASEAENWFLVAEDLVSAAEALEPKIKEYAHLMRERSRRRKAGEFLIGFYEPDVTGVYLMLIAYALENTCKGLLVAKNGKDWEETMAETGKLPDKLPHDRHDLRKLLEMIGFALNARDKKLASLLERSAVWSGRYPVPTKANDRTVQVAVVSKKVNRVEAARDFLRRVDQFVDEQLDEIRCAVEKA